MSGFQKVAPGASVEIEQQPVGQQAARVGSN